MPHKTKESLRQYRHRNSEKIRARQRNYRWKNLDQTRSSFLKSSYGITLEQYNRTLASQNGVCKICQDVERHTNKRWLSVDHCHTTGKVRGLLCSDCNTLLSRARDSILILTSAIVYLQEA